MGKDKHSNQKYKDMTVELYKSIIKITKIDGIYIRE